jgi:prophage regulatory protein
MPRKMDHSDRRILRRWDVIRQTGMSESTLWRMVRAGNFPVPVQLSENSIGWYENEVLAWLASRPRVSFGGSPRIGRSVA